MMGGLGRASSEGMNVEALGQVGLKYDNRLLVSSSKRLMSQSNNTPRNIQWLFDRRIVTMQYPTELPTQETNQYIFFENGTNQYYRLFASKAKINTFRSLIWHLTVLWYINPQLEPEEFDEVARFVADKENGFVTFNIRESVMSDIIASVYKTDLERPPQNKTRRVIFKQGSGLEKHEKLKLAGQLTGRVKKITSNDILYCMRLIHRDNQKITIQRISDMLDVEPRTIYRRMDDNMRIEKEKLNKAL